MATITIELSDEALALLAERALRRGRTAEQYGSQVMQQALVLGDRDRLHQLQNLKFHQRVIQCILDLLKDPTLPLQPPEVDNCLGDIRISCDHISKILDSVLSLRIDDQILYSHPHFENQFDKINLHSLLEKVQIIDRRSTYFRETHSLHFTIDDDVPKVITGDLDKLEQVLHNVVGNALKFSPDGGEIRLHARLSAPNLILFLITDQGMGMSPEFLTRFGEKFARASTEEIRSINGTGIGVFLCKAFLKTFGGRLWASSEGLGKGSTIYFTISTEVAMAHHPEFTSAVAELRRWRIKLGALVAEVETLPHIHYRFDATARADFAQLVHTELEQMQAFLVQLEKDHAADYD